MHSPLFVIFVALLLLIIDTYLLHGLRAAMAGKAIIRKKGFLIAYWFFCVGMATGLLLCIYVNLGVGFRAAFLMVFFITQLAKLCFLPFMLIDDLRRLFIRLSRKKSAIKTEDINISRSEFLMKAGVMATAFPIVSLAAGVVTKIGLFDYRIRRVNLYLPNLPKAFDGLRLGQISDIHSGSFHKRDRVAIRGGVEMLLHEKPDMIFFTGDIVNDLAPEIATVYDIFELKR